MGTYLMMLYVSLEQEKAVKTLFTSKGWGFKKPDLSMTTDKLGPLTVDDEPESEEEVSGKGRTKSQPATREASKRTATVKTIKPSPPAPKSAKKTSKVRVQLRKGGKKSAENSEFQEILEEAELITASINQADEEGDGEESEPFTVKVERDIMENSDYDGEDGEFNEEDIEEMDDYDDVTPSTSYLEAEADAESTDMSQMTIDTPKPAKRRKVTTKARERPTLPPVDLEDLEAMGDLSPIKQQLCKARRRRDYEPRQLFNACHAVKTQKMAIRKAARIFCVPEATIRHTMERCKRDEYLSMDTLPKNGPSMLLSEEEEKNIVVYLGKMSELGYDFHIRQVNRMATAYAVALGKRSQSDKTLTTHWFHSFNSRWPEVKICKKMKLSEVREKANSQDVLGQYNAKLKEVIETHALTERPDSIYVVDELMLPMEQLPDKAVNKTDNETSVEKEDEEKNFSIIGCGNASGSLVPPYFVLPGKRWHDRYLEIACEGSRGECSESGKLHSLTTKNYFKDHFTKFIKLGKHNLTTLVLYDGYKLHHPQLTLKEWADENNVVFFALPLHMSVATGQESGCFSPLKEAFRIEFDTQLQQLSHAIRLTNYDAAKVGSNAYLKAMTTLALKFFFKRLGIGAVKAEM